MAVDTTNELYYTVTLQNLILKINSTGGLLFKANPGSMTIYSIDLSNDLSKLLIAGTDDTPLCTLLVLSTADMSVLHYFQALDNSKCHASVSSDNYWYISG